MRFLFLAVVVAASTDHALTQVRTFRMVSVQCICQPHCSGCPVAQATVASAPRLCNCSDVSASQRWAAQPAHPTTLSQNGSCLAVGGLTSAAVMEACGAPPSGMPAASQQWALTDSPSPEVSQLVWACCPQHPKLCLTARPPPSGAGGPSGVDVEPCDSARPQQAFSYSAANGHLVSGTASGALCVSSGPCQNL
jgi:hypothetical protein